MEEEEEEVEEEGVEQGVVDEVELDEEGVVCLYLPFEVVAPIRKCLLMSEIVDTFCVCCENFMRCLLCLLINFLSGIIISK